MADSKRGGRSSDDEFDENDVLDELDESDDDADLDADLEEDSEDGGRKVAARTASKTARAGRARPATKDRKRGEAHVSLFGRLIRFIREVVAELQKVIYPTRKELLTYTSVVLVFVVVVMTVVALLDLGFAKLMFLVFGDKTTTT